MTRDELIKENASLVEGNEILGADKNALSAEVAALTEQAEATATAHAEAVATLQEQIDAAATRSADLNANITDVNAENADLSATVKEQSGEIDRLTAALATPANLDAAMLPATDAAPVLTDAEADKLDADALAAAEDAEPKTLKEQYTAMPFGPERQAFLESHRTEILNDTGTE